MAHEHDHGPRNYSRAFAIGVALNLTYVVVEAAYGLIGNSLALVADAGHNLSDVLGLLLAWGATWLVKRRPSPRRSYGFRRSSVLAALFNALFLLVAVGAIAWEAVTRLGNPAPVAGTTVIIVATFGIFVNGATALLFISGQKGDVNIRGAFLHMAADAGVSLGVVLAGVAIIFTDWEWLDPVVSLAIVVVIVIGTWGLLRESVDLACVDDNRCWEPRDGVGNRDRAVGVAEVGEADVVAAHEVARVCGRIVCVDTQDTRPSLTAPSSRASSLAF